MNENRRNFRLMMMTKKRDLIINYFNWYISLRLLSLLCVGCGFLLCFSFGPFFLAWEWMKHKRKWTWGEFESIQFNNKMHRNVCNKRIRFHHNKSILLFWHEKQADRLLNNPFSCVYLPIPKQDPTTQRTSIWEFCSKFDRGIQKASQMSRVNRQRTDGGPLMIIIIMKVPKRTDYWLICCTNRLGLEQASIHN